MLICGEAVSKTYANGITQVEGLKGVSFAIDKGEFVAIVGPSGSGKSTMMNLVGLLDRPTSGKLRIAGENVSELSEHRRALLRARTIGFVFQSYHLIARSTAVDNVAMPLIYAGINVNERRRRAMIALERVHLAEKALRRPAEMSGGEQQRVAIARAMIREPDILLADEPTGALDGATGRSILSLFSSLNAAGHTIVLITHDCQIAACAQRSIRLEDGRIEEETNAGARRH